MCVWGGGGGGGGGGEVEGSGREGSNVIIFPEPVPLAIRTYMYGTLYMYMYMKAKQVSYYYMYVHVHCIYMYMLQHCRAHYMYMCIEPTYNVQYLHPHTASSKIIKCAINTCIHVHVYSDADLQRSSGGQPLSWRTTHSQLPCSSVESPALWLAELATTAQDERERDFILSTVENTFASLHTFTHD